MPGTLSQKSKPNLSLAKQKHMNTGMGMERITSMLLGKTRAWHAGPCCMAWMRQVKSEMPTLLAIHECRVHCACMCC